jgi:integrase
MKVLPLDGDVKEALLKLPRHITCPFVFQKNGQHYSITAAVERAGYDDVQEFVGHANRAMTKRYGRMNVKRLERVLRPKMPRG